MGRLSLVLLVCLITGSLATSLADNKCRDRSGNFPIRGKCQVFVRCLDGKASLHACKKNSIFHRKLRTCIPSYFIPKDYECAPERVFGVGCDDGDAGDFRSYEEMCDRSSGLCLPSGTVQGPAVYAAPKYVVQPPRTSTGFPAVGMDMGSVQAIALAQAQAQAGAVGEQDWSPLVQKYLHWAAPSESPRPTGPGAPGGPVAPPRPVAPAARPATTSGFGDWYLGDGYSFPSLTRPISPPGPAAATRPETAAPLPVSPAKIDSTLSSLQCDDGTRPTAATPPIQVVSCMTRPRPVQVLIERPTPVFNTQVVTRTRLVTVTQTAAVPQVSNVPITSQQQQIGNVFLEQGAVQVSAQTVDVATPERIDLTLEEVRPVVNTVTVQKPVRVERPVMVDNVQNVDVHITGTAGVFVKPQEAKNETTVHVFVTKEETVGRIPVEAGPQKETVVHVQRVPSREPCISDTCQQVLVSPPQPVEAVPRPDVSIVRPMPAIQVPPPAPTPSVQVSLPWQRPSESAQEVSQPAGVPYVFTLPFQEGTGATAPQPSPARPTVQTYPPYFEPEAPVSPGRVTVLLAGRRPATTIVVGKKLACYPTTSLICDEASERAINNFGKMPWYERPWFRSWAFEQPPEGEERSKVIPLLNDEFKKLEESQDNEDEEGPKGERFKRSFDRDEADHDLPYGLEDDAESRGAFGFLSHRPKLQSSEMPAYISPFDMEDIDRAKMTVDDTERQYGSGQWGGRRWDRYDRRRPYDWYRRRYDRRRPYPDRYYTSIDDQENPIGISQSEGSEEFDHDKMTGDDTERQYGYGQWGGRRWDRYDRRRPYDMYRRPYDRRRPYPGRYNTVTDDQENAASISGKEGTGRQLITNDRLYRYPYWYPYRNYPYWYWDRRPDWWNRPDNWWWQRELWRRQYFGDEASANGKEDEAESRSIGDKKEAVELGLHFRSGLLTGTVKKTEGGYEIPSSSIEFHSDVDNKKRKVKVDASLIQHVARFLGSDANGEFEVPILVVSSKDDEAMMDFRNADVITADSPQTEVKVAEEVDEKGLLTAITLPLETIASISKSADAVRQKIIDSLEPVTGLAQARGGADFNLRSYNLALAPRNRPGLDRCSDYMKCYNGRPFLRSCKWGHAYSRFHGKCMPKGLVQECWNE